MNRKQARRSPGQAAQSASANATATVGVRA